MKISPPHRALRFLRWFCREDYLEEIEGDLMEIFEIQSEESPKKARRRFTWSVIRYFRPEFIKSFSSNYHLTSTAMLRHYFLITFRNFNRYKSSFIINLTGLSAGLASVIFIYLWVLDEFSIDKFNEKDANLYQVLHNIPQSDGIFTCEYTPGLLAETLTEEFPEVEYAASVVPPSWFSRKGIISSEDIRFKAAAQYVGKDYFDIFSCPFVAGNKKQLIENKYAVAISEELALKLFKSKDDVIGKTIYWEKEDLSGTYDVAGIFTSPPANATEQFEIIFNYEIFLEARPFLQDWGNSDPCTYLILNDPHDIEQLNNKITSLLHSKVDEKDHSMFVRKYSDQHLYNNFENGKQAGGRIEYVYLFIIVALFLLVIACVNFMNLATAKASTRIKEIGVKKAIGAGRNSLIAQFLSESTALTVSSLLLAVLIVLFFLPQFNQITGKHLRLDLNTNMMLGLGTIVILTSLISGSYPAFYLSAFKPVGVLKGNSIKNYKAKSNELLTRSGLVIFQFSLSILFIIAVLVIQDQISYIQSKNLGYNRNNLLHFGLDLSAIEEDGESDEMESKIEAFLNEASVIPGVRSVFNYGHDLIGFHGVLSGVDWKEGDEDDQVNFRNLEMGYDFLSTMDIKLKEGRAYSKEFTNEESKVIFNEEAIRIMNLTNPIGKVIKLWGREREIIGVVRNFNLESLHESIKPCVIQLNPGARNIMARVQPGAEKETICALQTLYSKYCPGLPFEYKFVDKDFERVYASENRVGLLSKYFTVIAILISCLGLFGLTTYATEQRTKEVGIRKVLGASAANLVVLLSRDFIHLIVIAFIIAIPVGWYLLNSWLEKFAYRIDLEWWVFGISCILVFVVAVLTVGYQTLKTAKLNPVKSLRNE